MSDKTPVDLTPEMAHKLIQDDPRTILIDIRSNMEYLFVGHPVGAVHVPWIDEPDWVINPHFVTDIRKLILGGAVCSMEDGCAPVILICRSGKRSLEASALLMKEGFTRVYHVGEGFEGELDDNHQRSTVGGWRHHGLPWEQC